MLSWQNRKMHYFPFHSIIKRNDKILCHYESTVLFKGNVPVYTIALTIIFKVKRNTKNMSTIRINSWGRNAWLCFLVFFQVSNWEILDVSLERSTDVNMNSKTWVLWSLIQSLALVKKPKGLLYIMYYLNRGNAPQSQPFFWIVPLSSPADVLTASANPQRQEHSWESDSLTFRVDKQLQGSGTNRSESWGWV